MKAENRKMSTCNQLVGFRITRILTDSICPKTSRALETRAEIVIKAGIVRSGEGLKHHPTWKNAAGVANKPVVAIASAVIGVEWKAVSGFSQQIIQHPNKSMNMH